MIYARTTTLVAIRAAGPCGIRSNATKGWAKLLRTLGEPHGKPNLARAVTILEVLDSNGLDDAVWVISCVMPDDRLSRHLFAWYAERVLHLFEDRYPGDMRLRQEIAVNRDDNATENQRRDAWNAAWNAAQSVAHDDVLHAARAAARVDDRAAQEAQLRRMLGGVE